MASDEVKKEKKSKDKSEKDKKDKKHSESAGITKDKKDKKKDKAKQDKLARALDAHLQADAAAAVEESGAAAAAAAVDPEDLVKTAEELVPFALPLADDKTHKKIYKLIKKGAKLKSIHRGVKECEKAIRKCPLKKAAPSSSDAPGLVIIAGDISPMDVIMHFPILCEEHGVPYLYVRSRADLGVAACTKRATSVVMLKPEGKKPAADAAGKNNKKNKDGDDEMNVDGDDKKVSPEEYLESWKDLVKLAQKQWHVQVEPWVKGVHPLQIAASSMVASS
ncbi:L30e-like protein [Diplogelasinospora grovesii]|uniref:L30e-like protein n=1 Tax=Diplogelasinospora grovesii TaxID=303347 RepID=A0AAN6NAM2_9PEZI|nr:L30e-like protein [Diplogelasinospora grovesii]